MERDVGAADVRAAQRSGGGASSPEQPNMPIPVDKAMQLVQAAHSEAESIDLAITAVVVDESGRLVALGRMDGARPISVDIAMNKAMSTEIGRARSEEHTSE